MQITTELKAWWINITPEKKREVLKVVTKKTECKEWTVRRWLQKQPSKLAQEILSQESGIPIEKMYKSKIII